jgi:hypothetical protein
MPMTDNKTYAFYALSQELNRREFRKKLDLFPAEMRHYVILANGIIGSENAKRVAETPEAVVEDGREFVAKLLGLVGPEPGDGFSEILETSLVETMKDELRRCCPNCENFCKCLDLDNLTVGSLFARRANGEETAELKKEIETHIENALLHTPHIDTDSADELCGDFRHQYPASRLGEVFGRYSEIAAELRDAFGINYGKILQAMILVNLEFLGKSGEDGKG